MDPDPEAIQVDSQYKTFLQSVDLTQMENQELMIQLLIPLSKIFQSY